MIKIQVTLPRKTIDLIKKNVLKRHITATAFVNGSIHTEYYIRQQLNEGSRVLILRSDGSLHEVIFN